MNQIKKLLTTLFIIILAHAAKSQDNYSLSLQDASLTELIDTLSQLINCQFSYPSSILKNNDRTDISISSLELDNLLNESFTQFDLEYAKANSKTILLRKKNKSSKTNSENQKKANQITIRGQVKDNESASPIEYAAISIPKHNIVEFSDSNGGFEIAILNFDPLDKVTIHMLGYDVQEMSLEKFIISPAVELRAKPYDIPEITILERMPDLILAPQALRLTNRGLQNLGVGLAGNDVMRSLQMLPGIDASDDSSTDLKIRGSNADETLIILDGVPLYNTSHYYGIFSSINTDYIEKVNIYKNTQPIEYGNKTAGIVEFASNNDLNEPLKGKVKLNLLESSITLNTPVSENSFLTLSGRKTLRDITNTSFNSIGDRRNRGEGENPVAQNYVDRDDAIRSEPEFNFWDVQAKYSLALNGDNSVQVNFFKSDDNYSNDIENRFFVNKDGSRYISDEDTKISEDWNNTGLGISWTNNLSKSLQLDVNSYYSKYDITNTTFSESSFYGRNSEQLEETIRKEQSQFNKVQDIGLNIQLKKNIKNTNVHGGLKIVQHSTEFEINFSDDLEIEQNANATEITSYAELNHTFLNSLNITGGLRGHYYTGTNKVYFSPQISSSIKVSNQATLKTSIGRNHQFLRELTVESNFANNIDRWVLADGRRLPVSNSINSMIGMTFKKNKLLFDAELFYKKMNNITELSLGSTRATASPEMNPLPMDKLFVGKGNSYGLDLLMSSDFKHVNTQIAYTLSKVQHSFMAVDRGRYFDAPNDRTHQFKLINEFLINDFSMGVNYTYTSGRVYTDLNKLTGLVNFDRAKVDPRDFKSRLPHYHRLDLSLNYSLTNQFVPITIGIGIFNVFDRNNVKYQQQIQGTEASMGSPLKNIVLGTNSDLLGRTLNLSLGLKF